MKIENLYDPEIVHTELVRHIEGKSGKQIVDPSNSYALMLESIALVTSDALAETANLVRGNYPTLCQEPYEIMRHATGVETIGLFATPATGVITLFVNAYDVFAHGIDSVINGAKMVEIKAGSRVVIDERIDLTIENDIRIHYDGSIGVVEQLTTQDYGTNKFGSIKSYIINPNGAESKWIMFDIQTTQFKKVTHEIEVVSKVIKKLLIRDQLWFIKVYGIFHNEVLEMELTFSDIVYDLNKPTVKCTLVDDGIIIELPNIYQVNKTAPTTLIVDVYETRGKIKVLMNEYEANHFSFISDINNVGMESTNVYALSNNVISGGSDTKDFASVRRSIINNVTGPLDRIITVAQLVERGRRDGYFIKLYSDMLTHRLYTYSKNVDPNTFRNLPSDPNIFLLNVNLNKDVVNDNIIYRDSKVIIPRETIFTIDGTIPIPSKDKILEDTLFGKGGYTDNRLIEVLSSKRHFFSLFTNVIYTDNEMRSYELHKPIISDINVVNRNLTPFIINISDAKMIHKQEGYVIDLTLTTDTISYETLPIEGQLLVFTSEVDYVTYFGEFYLDGDNGHLQFKIETSSFVSKDGKIGLISPSGIEYTTPLSSRLKLIIYTTEKQETETPYLEEAYLTIPEGEEYTGLTTQTFEVEWGKLLKNLFSEMTIDYTEQRYKTYSEDVPHFYERDIYDYEINNDCSSIGKATVVHKRGEIKYMPQTLEEIRLGTPRVPVIRHKKGDVILENDIPIIDRTYGVEYNLNLVCLELEYLISGTRLNNDAIEIVKAYINTFLSFGDVLSDGELESTDFKFIPMKNISVVTVELNDVEVLLPQVISPKITLYVDKNITFEYDVATIGRIIEYSLEKEVITYDSMRDSIKNKLGIIGVSIDDLGIPFKSEMIKVKNSQFVLKKVLNPLKEVVYDIDITVTPL